MRKTFVPCLVLLALVAWTAPGFAATEIEPPAETGLAPAVDEPAVDELLLDEEDPHATPAEEPDLHELLDLPQNDWQQKIRECTEQEKYVHCGSTACECVFAGLNFYCFC